MEIIIANDILKHPVVHVTKAYRSLIKVYSYQQVLVPGIPHRRHHTCCMSVKKNQKLNIKGGLNVSSLV